MCEIQLDLEKYRSSVCGDICSPPSIMAPFINIDPIRYEELRSANNSPLPIAELRPRLDDEQYASTIGAVSLTLNHAMTFFPAYRFFVEDFLKAEWLALLNWEGFHRDHILHQSLTSFIGMTLLMDLEFDDDNVTCDDKITLLDKCVDVFLSQGNFFYQYLQKSQVPKRYTNLNDIGVRILWKSILLDIFFLAAIFHDMGQPWKFVNLIHNKLDKHSPINDPSGKGAEWIANRYQKRLLFSPLKGYSMVMPCDPAHWHDTLVELVRVSLRKTHGFPGAISFLYLNDILRKFPDKDYSGIRQFCVEWAAVAIMMHDMEGIYRKENNPQLRISFDIDPISFVLTLSDIMQDFGRANSLFSSDTDKVVLRYNRKCESIRITLEKDILKIIYVFNQKGDYLLKKHKFIPKEQKRLFHHKEGYLDFKSLGIKDIILDAELNR